MKKLFDIDFREKEKFGEMVAVVGPDIKYGIKISALLRRNYIITESFVSKQSLKKQMIKANKMHSMLQCAVFANPDNLKIKDMWTGNEKAVEESNLISSIESIFEDGIYDD